MNEKSFIIDYLAPDGSSGWKCVHAASADDAVRVFHLYDDLCDGWSGFKFSEYKITAVTERS